MIDNEPESLSDLLNTLFGSDEVPEIPARPQASEFDVKALQDVPDLARVLCNRVSEKDAASITGDESDEHYALLNGSREQVLAWIGENVPGYRNDRLYACVREAEPDMSEDDALRWYADMKWRKRHFTHHEQFLREEALLLKEELDLMSRVMGSIPD